MFYITNHLICNYINIKALSSFFLLMTLSEKRYAFFTAFQSLRIIFLCLQTVPIKEKERVWSRNVNGRYYQAKVLKVHRTLLHAIYFPHDQSFADDVKTEAIVNHKNSTREFHVRDKVQVKCLDGATYEGMYIGKVHIETYTVSN